MTDIFESMKLEMIRRGQGDRVTFLENLPKQIPPSQILRIQQNDKTVLKDMVLPKWLEWDTLFLWSNQYAIGKGRPCILCNRHEEHGLDFKEKWICEGCFLKIKDL